MYTYRTLTRGTIPRVRLLAVIAAALLLPAASHADNLTVDCTGVNASAFPSISAALGSLALNSATEPHTITVTGPCTENVNLTNRQRITIEAPVAQTAAIQAASPAGRVFTINGSRAIVLRRLVLSGGTSSAGVFLDRDSEVVMEGVTIESNAVGINANSSAVLLGGSTADRAVVIRNNTFSGVAATGGFLTLAGNVTIENNGGALNQTGGQLVVNGNSAENIFRNNSQGIGLNVGVAASFNGKNTIQNNGLDGVSIGLGSTASFNARVLPDSTVLATLIEGHTEIGINVLRTGQLSMFGRHIVRNNGTATADPVLRSGIRISRADATIVGGVEITGNAGPGIRVDTGSTVLVADVTTSNNSEQGINILTMSVAGVFGPLTAVGNGTASIACDRTSLLAGDENLIGIAGISCKNIEREQGPPRPGRIR